MLHAVVFPLCSSERQSGCPVVSSVLCPPLQGHRGSSVGLFTVISSYTISVAMQRPRTVRRPAALHILSWLLCCTFIEHACVFLEGWTESIRLQQMNLTVITHWAVPVHMNIWKSIMIEWAETAKERNLKCLCKWQKKKTGHTIDQICNRFETTHEATPKHLVPVLTKGSPQLNSINILTHLCLFKAVRLVFPLSYLWFKKISCLFCEHVCACSRGSSTLH